MYVMLMHDFSISFATSIIKTAHDDGYFPPSLPLNISKMPESIETEFSLQEKFLFSKHMNNAMWLWGQVTALSEVRIRGWTTNYNFSNPKHQLEVKCAGKFVLVDAYLFASFFLSTKDLEFMSMSMYIWDTALKKAILTQTLLCDVFVT